MLPLLVSKAEYSPSSRIWAYTANRPLNESEVEFVQSKLNDFCRSWTAHDQALKATSEIFGDNVLFLMVDEAQAGASGCSIDKSVHFLEELGSALDVDFFERMRFAWMDQEGNVCWSDRTGLQSAVESGKVGPETPMLNTLVQTKSELEEKVWIPFGKSWHRRVV